MMYRMMMKSTNLTAEKICITPSVYQKIKECYKQRFNDSELTVAMLFLACGPKMTVNEFPDKKYIAEVEDGFVVEEMEDED